MNFQALQQRAASLAEFERWTDATDPAQWDVLVNRAWLQFSWDAELVVDSVSVEASVGQAQLTLPVVNNGPFKEVLDVIWDFGGANTPVYRSTEAFQRNVNPSWLSAASGTPAFWVFSSYDVISLSPPPAAVKTVWVRGICQGQNMVANTDLPGQVSGVGMPIPEALHEPIAYRAAWLQGVGYAQGAALERLTVYEQRYKDAIAACRQGLLKGYRRHTEEEA